MPLGNHCEIASYPDLRFYLTVGERPGLVCYLGDIKQLLEVKRPLGGYKAVESDGGQVAHCHLETGSKVQWSHVGHGSEE